MKSRGVAGDSSFLPRFAGQGVRPRGDQEPHRRLQIVPILREPPGEEIEQWFVQGGIAEAVVVGLADERLADQRLEDPIREVAAELVAAALENEPCQLVLRLKGGRGASGAERQEGRCHGMVRPGTEELAGHHRPAGGRARIGKIGRERSIKLINFS